MTSAEILKELTSQANPRNVAGMARFGINPNNTLGIPIPFLRGIAKRAGKDHALALELWASGIHEARILAALIDEPEKVTETQLEEWVRAFDSWDVCDQVCSNLFDRTSFAYPKAFEWAGREAEFVKRAGFVLMAALAVHDKSASDSRLAKFLPLIKRHAVDERNFVRKAVNWALRQIGKRNETLRQKALRTAFAIERIGTTSARWVARDAVRELEKKQFRRHPASRAIKRTPR